MEEINETAVMSDEEINAIIDKGEKRKTTQSKKPIGKKTSPTNNKPFSKHKNTGRPNSEPTRGKGSHGEVKLKKLKYLSIKDLNAILKNNGSTLAIEKEIGSGGFSRVYRLKRNTSIGNGLLAVKVTDRCMAYKEQFPHHKDDLTLDMLDDDSMFQYICQLSEKEMKVNEEISNRNLPHCVRYYKDLSFMDETVRKGISFMVMDLMEGNLIERPESLAKEVENYQIAFDMLNQTLEDLQFLCEHHGDANIFSRDIKPQNILYRRDGDSMGYYLSDFGMASIGEEYSNETRIGKNSYTAPEAKKDIRSELFSLARIAFYICNGFSLGDSNMDSLEFQNQQTQETEYWDHTPKELRDIIQKATDPYPEKRYKDASEMLRAVQALDFDRDRKIKENTNATVESVIGKLARKHLEEVEALKKRIEELETSFLSANNQVKDLNSQVNTRDKTIRSLREENDRLKQQNGQIKTLLDKIAQLEKVAQDRDSSAMSWIKEKEELQAKIDTQEKQIIALLEKEKKLNQLMPKFSTMQDDLVELTKRNSELQDELSAAKTKIDELTRQIDGKSLLDTNEDATVTSIDYDVLKTIAFIFWFGFLVVNQRHDILPWMMVTYMVSILLNAISSRIAMRKDTYAFWLYVGLLAMGMVSLGFVFWKFEQMIPLFPKIYSSEIPFIGMLVTYGNVSMVLIMLMLAIEDMVLDYAKYVKNSIRKVAEITNSMLVLNGVFAAMAILMLLIK